MDIDYNGLKLLESVSLAQTFSEASRRVGLTQSAVSQRIRQLEGEWGGPLLVRSNPVALTPLGREALNHLQKVRLLEADLSSRIDRVAAPSTLKLAMNTESLALWMLPALQRAFAKNSFLAQILICDQDETLELLKRGEVVACVSSSSKSLSGCRSIELGSFSYRLVSTPGFQEHHFPQGISPDALGTAPAILYGQSDLIHDKFLHDLGMTPQTGIAHYIPSPQGMLEGVLLELGFALLPELMVGPHLDGGRLIDLAPGRSYQLALSWHFVDLENQALGELTHSIRESLSEIL